MSAIAECSRTERHILTNEGARDADSSKKKEVQNAVLLFAEAWVRAKGQVQSQLEQGTHGLNPERINGLQEVGSNILPSNSNPIFYFYFILGCDGDRPQNR